MNTCMESTPTHNLWFWPKRPPLAFSVAETSVAEMSRPKRHRQKCLAEMSYIRLGTPEKQPFELHFAGGPIVAGFFMLTGQGPLFPCSSLQGPLFPCSSLQGPLFPCSSLQGPSRAGSVEDGKALSHQVGGNRKRQYN